MEFHDKKDISKVFSYLRNQLNAKEKELLELQRAQPCLLAPDSKQIEGILDAITALHLSTQDGSFVFATNLNSNESTTVHSSGVDSIKTLPSTTWLPDANLQRDKNEQNPYRLPMVTQLFSLPMNAFVKSSSSSNNSPVKPVVTVVEDEPSNRLPMVSQMMSMPISAFRKSSSTNESTDIQPENRLPMVNQMMNMPISAFKSSSTVTNNDQPENRLPAVTEIMSMPISAFTKSSSSVNKPQPVQIDEKKQTVPKSILTSESTYSKEHWLKRAPSSSESDSDFEHLDLDKYIEQSNEKMRRLHLEYRQAIEKLNTPVSPVPSSAESVQTLKSIYPQMFDRLNEDLTPPTRSSSTPTKK